MKSDNFNQNNYDEMKAAFGRETNERREAVPQAATMDAAVKNFSKAFGRYQYAYGDDCICPSTQKKSKLQISSRNQSRVR